MDNHVSNDEYKKLLALMCAQNEFTPSILEATSIKNILIKSPNDPDWIPISTQEEYKKYQDPESVLDAKINYVDAKNNEKEKLIPNIKDMELDLKDNKFTALSNINNQPWLYSTTDFMDMYHEAMRTMHPEIGTHLHALHTIAQEVGKPLVFVPRDLDIVDKSKPVDQRDPIFFDELREGMSVRMEGPMHSPDIDECPDQVDTRVLGFAHSEFSSFEITVMEGEDAIYVSYDMYPDLYMDHESTTYNDPHKGEELMNELLLEEYWIKKISEGNQEPELDPGKEVGPTRPDLPGIVYCKKDSAIYQLYASMTAPEIGTIQPELGPDGPFLGR